MRIGFDIGPISKNRTGVGNYCFYLLKNLIALDPSDQFIGFASGRRRPELDALSGKLPYRWLSCPTRLLYKSWTYLRRPRVDRMLGGVDLYHATNYFLPPTEKARRVVTIHDLAFLATPGLCSPSIVGPFSANIRRFARDADGVLVYSQSTKNDVLRFLDVPAERVTVAPMAVDEDFVPMPRESAIAHLKTAYHIEGPFLLFVSTLEPRKNVPTLLRAFARLTDLPHRLVMIGSIGWNSDPIFEAIRELGLEDRIIRPGFVPHLELPAFFCAANAFVFPTLYEGFGLPLLEALTCGCPVVASDNSSVPEVTGGAALTMDAMDIEGIADAVRRVISDTALRESLVARGLEHAKRFSWPNCAATTLDLYRKLTA
ncbi:MAG: glycosyltransferase family 4 protein [Candidatus Hydrogenedentes bacterium]|nr:glycosyltransferase family 4 protein [Candidatus Hydrogenedentota bacterium]